MTCLDRDFVFVIQNEVEYIIWKQTANVSYKVNWQPIFFDRGNIKLFEWCISLYFAFVFVTCEKSLKSEYLKSAHKSLRREKQISELIEGENHFN